MNLYVRGIPDIKKKNKTKIQKILVLSLELLRLTHKKMNHSTRLNLL
jgi:hypothetical protein